MRWVDLFALDTFLAHGGRWAVDAAAPRSARALALADAPDPIDPTERVEREEPAAIDAGVADGTGPVDRIDPADVDDFTDVLRDDDLGVADPLDGADTPGDEWDAETLDEIPEELEGPAADALGASGLWPVYAAVLRRARAGRRLS
jgi:hypothetical protein